MTETQTGWERVGRFGVDAGICWIGDPCYLAPKPGGAGAEVLADWQDFCARLDAAGHDERGATAWPMPDGREGRGVVVTTGLGDGVYDVEVRRIEDELWGRRIAEVRIRFIDDDPEGGIAPAWATDDGEKEV